MSKKINISEMIIETTRRCNMHCAHCMRGESENKDLPDKYLKNTLKQINAIDSIVFTGGEPTLNIACMTNTLNYCKEYKIPVYSFYVVTNGKEITDEFLTTMIRWYTYCIQCYGEPEICGVALSKDDYHDPIPPENEAKLRALSFYRPDDKDTRNWSHPSLLNLGRARNIRNVPLRERLKSEPTVETYDDTITVSECPITLTVNGDIILEGDYEYDNIDDIYLCRYDKLTETIENIAEKDEKVECDSDTCMFNPKGICMINKIKQRKPIITEEDGCKDYIPKNEI